MARPGTVDYAKWDKLELEPDPEPPKPKPRHAGHGHGHGHGSAHGGCRHTCGGYGDYVAMVEEVKAAEKEKRKPDFNRLQHSKREPKETISFEDQMAKCARLKEEGNELYRARSWHDAGCKYTEVVQGIEPFMAEFELILKPDDKRLVDSILLPTRLNLAACMVKCDFEIEAVEQTRLVLQEDPTNVKAYWRRAQVGRPVCRHVCRHVCGHP